MSVNLKCSSKDTLSITSMTPFQGDLKKRKDSDIDAMIASIKEEGMLMPIAIWQQQQPTDGVVRNMILDGHGRYTALIKMALEDTSILSQELPVVYIDANTESEARQALLQITSQYGKITKPGLIKFTATIPNYKAPAVQSVMKKVQTTAVKAPDKIIVRLRIPKERVVELTKLLKQVDWIEVY